MLRLAFIAVLLPVALAPAAPPTPAEIRDLVRQLGSDEFAEREAATKQLDAAGAPALDDLRAALRSENPEVARRARELIRKIGRRVDNDKTLAPTIVELSATDERLDDVLADLSKQSKYTIVLGGPKQAELANRKLTLSTGGKVPFWSAVLKICDAAELQVACAGGFLAPDAMPYLGRAPRGVRVAAKTEQAIVLEARGDAKRRPAAVHGAVLIEAVPFPKGAHPAGPAALIQVWPEPKLAWRAVNGARTSSAKGADGKKLAIDISTPQVPATGVSGPLAPPRPVRNARGGVIIIRNADGSARVVRDGENYTTAGQFQPNARQVLVKCQGDSSTTVAHELRLTILGTVQSGIEPLAVADGLKENALATGTSPAGVEMTVRYGKNATGRLVATMNLEYDRRFVDHAGVGVALPGTKGGNWTVQGVRITDVDGKPYTLGVMGGSSRSDGNGRLAMTYSLELHPDKDGHGPPAVATFWGNYAKPVEIPIVLKDVPLGGK